MRPHIRLAGLLAFALLAPIARAAPPEGAPPGGAPPGRPAGGGPGTGGPGGGGGPGPLEGPVVGSGVPASERQAIAWYGTWKGGLAEAERSGRPILLMAAAPQCHGISGVW